jgi:hypothetical protein
MAYGAELAGAAAPVRFIYVWPSRELIARSWSWRASWHEAFQDAASRIGLAVAIYLLEGRGLSQRLISLRLSIGFTRFRVKRRGRSILITVVEFTGPDSPEPDGPGPDGPRQPSAVDGLVLGLHGSGKEAYLVVFHGHMPPVPAGELLSSRGAGGAPVLKICRATQLRSSAEPPMAHQSRPDGTGSADKIAKPIAAANAAEDPNASGPGVRGLSPILNFRLAAGRPIYVARSSRSLKRSRMPHSQEQSAQFEPVPRDASMSRRGKLLVRSHKIYLSEDARLDSRLNFEKLPSTHLRSRYLH